MTNRFMISVAAAALIAGAGFANAQQTGNNPSAGSTVQQSSPSSDRGAPPSATMNRSDEKPAAKTTQSEEKSPGAKNMRAQDDLKAGAKGEKSAQDSGMKGEKSKSMSSEDNAKGGSKEMKAEGTKSGTMSPDSKSSAQTKGTTDTKSQTTGNAATSATAAPPAEKQTQIASAIRSEKVEEVKNVNFNISVGAVVPSSVRFHVLPTRIVEIYPEWRGYDFIFVNGRYIILRPRTHEIVYIIEG
jgi:hypothetical protein